MASDFPAASSSSQQPFANPQPAPISAASHATSPPTKQSLKSWWKGFRPPTKSHDAPGNSPSIRNLPQKFFFAENYPTRVPRNLKTVFREHPMDETISSIDGLPVEDASSASLFRRASVKRTISFQDEPKPLLQSVPVGNGKVNPANLQRPMTANSNSRTCGWRLQTPCQLVKRSSRSRTFIADSSSESSVLGAGILPGPKSRPLSHYFSALLMRSRSAQENKAKQIIKAVEQPTGIFGVPLRQSISYANVAISLVDANGKSYIYGYVPIVVAKCGVYLKEKATNVEGIFRLSGSEKRIKELKTIFDSPDRYGKGLDWAGYTVHDAANVLRRYLNQLPEPIVPLDLYGRFREPLRGHTTQAVGDTEGPQSNDKFDIQNAIATYQQLITELPPLNRQLLLYILDLLAVFASKSDENRMNSQNLAAIFQPGMLSHPSHDMAPVEYRLSQDVLIFLIENQDHFLIGMRGTAADEQTVQEVQNGGTPPPGTPNTPGRKNIVGRSSSNASAGADSVRKFGGIRRNVSVSSRHSRQSNGAPSPASPAYGASLNQTTSGGVHRSNTVPSKKSPALPQNRLQKTSGSQSPTAAGVFPSQNATPRGLSPSARQIKPSLSPGTPSTATGTLNLAPSSHTDSAITSQERLLGDQKSEFATPSKERNLSNLFQRSPTMEIEKKPANKLRKKRIPSSSNPSAQSSTHSLHGPQSAAASPGTYPAGGIQDVAEHPQLESIPLTNPDLVNAGPTTPLTETSRAEYPPNRPQESSHPSDNTLKPVTSPTSSLHSRSSFNDQSDLDHHEDAAAMEQHEKRSRWRLSRRRDESQAMGNTLSPKKGLGAETNAGASSSSLGSSSRPRKSFTGDTVPVSSDSMLAGTHLHSSNDSAPAGSATEEKKGPLGWFKKIRDKRDDREAEKDRTKSPPASTDRIAQVLPTRGKSMEVKREETPAPVSEMEPPHPRA
ncbi:Rho-GTPase-activating 5 [Hyphodiscus hymeniophilus]|uniref:Rho-GTPase-activating 5 n=1 Tax=Hyphodiscus hymeniophilus TaxID=353542 RepID=A0A9P6SQ19_9HELO|nr:Rho-GTPase-activating 5 [Hyphodiscus hymeniophilus]